MKPTEQQLRDPWGWCKQVFVRHAITPNQLSEDLQMPRSTVGALLNDRHSGPRYDLLVRLIDYAIAVDTGAPLVREVVQPVDYDFM